MTTGTVFSEAATFARLKKAQKNDLMAAAIQRLNRLILSIAICILSGSPSSIFLLPADKKVNV
jgi:hypothetical protein